ncbi:MULTISPECIES: NAD(P)/FAD-dependent oxidoreductase [unclassified Mycobacterium]|uniref:NAD(P)/FAD-dependent oxidoreductase n=1 Tax=unclassified Mycobacterium TaxID=2642494 RepID=UPI0008014C85|nr:MULTISPECIES: NAD(P)/FAD-dependent oxidoreductase [unclassified Mycobacterium]OBG54708.1 NADH dehydrogenase [Mycobacterium sp. E188]OBG62890.1 NADH dehydrogenase [Mycobacterium sp. E735]OBG69255.1 NADH dehydrogenase [Mycobacterium sp. E3298]OBG70829.1 NADH dehydrogenase [Mycobacterium sp. E3305]OBH10520.1 NADH dehydrogenase [Mycobacterium sp. E1715]
MSRHRVVIIGSGFGGLNAAKALKRADVDVTLISKTTTHLFQPLLYQVATGILSEGDVAPTTRLILRRQKNVRVLWGDVNAIDLTAKTVTSHLMGMETVTPFDSLIVAAGAQQSYFGHDEYAAFAPGMKSVDDALELRARILGAFEAAEVATDPAERQRRLTFVVVGAGPTGVELAGEIVQLAERTLAGAFRTITPSECRVILLDAAPAVLPPMGENLGLKAKRRLQKMDVEVQLNAMVTSVDYMGITVKEKDGGERRIECACKVWAAGVQASELGKMVAEQSDGTETDRAGRVIVEPDLTVKGHPYVFVIGDLMSVPGVPGMAQGAIQGAHYVTKLIKQAVKGQDDPANRKPFNYFDKGSMALISRYSAVAKVGKLEFGGFIAWLAWLLLHLLYLVGFRNRIAAMFSWGISFLGRTRGQMAITSQMMYARPVVDWVERQAQEGSLAAAERIEAAEKQAG